uniref:Uncharacterized protein n=1 Tax=Oryza meridionalis TaxID=40149 RepID=A0A0E0CKK6_9ORYZ
MVAVWLRQALLVAADHFVIRSVAHRILKKYYTK